MTNDALTPVTAFQQPSSAKFTIFPSYCYTVSICTKDWSLATVAKALDVMNLTDQDLWTWARLDIEWKHPPSNGSPVIRSTDPVKLTTEGQKLTFDFQAPAASIVKTGDRVVIKIKYGSQYQYFTHHFFEIEGVVGAPP